MIYWDYRQIFRPRGLHLFRAHTASAFANVPKFGKDLFSPLTSCLTQFLWNAELRRYWALPGARFDPRADTARPCSFPRIDPGSSLHPPPPFLGPSLLPREAVLLCAAYQFCIFSPCLAFSFFGIAHLRSLLVPDTSLFLFSLALDGRLGVGTVLSIKKALLQRESKFSALLQSWKRCILFNGPAIVRYNWLNDSKSVVLIQNISKRSVSSEINWS